MNKVFASVRKVRSKIEAHLCSKAPSSLFSLYREKFFGRVCFVILGCLAIILPGRIFSGEVARSVVYVAPIEGMIDLGLAPFVQRVLDEAAAAGASAVILEINTFGGRVDAAVLIRDALLNARVKTVAFVNKRQF